MKRKIVSTTLSLLVLLAIFALSASAQSFDPVFDWVARFRQGEDVELGLRLKADTFTVFRKQTTRIDKAKFSQLSTSSAPRDVSLKLKQDVKYLVFEMSDDLELEEQLSSGPAATAESTSWTKTETIPIETYPLSRWADFIKAALNQGLLEYEQDQFGEQGDETTTLYFKQNGPSRFQYGTRALTFSESFYQFMKLSENYKPTVGSQGCVIIVHDPHWSRSGRFQVIPGLKSLIDGNKQNSYIFLVEGAYTDPTRRIGFSTLDRVINQVRKTGSPEPVVYGLLSRYLIDSSLAYRLLYDQALPSMAIDDPRFFKKGSPNSAPLSRRKVAEAIVKIDKVAEGLKLPEAEYKEVSGLASLVLAYTVADISQAGDQSLVDYHNDMVENIDALIKLAQYLAKADPTANLDSEIASLNSQLQTYKAEGKIYADAMQRNIVMAQQISAQAKWASGRVPIAFIGNFHTSAIINRLREQNIGYVVIEPRFNSLTSPKEREDFNNYIYPGARQNYIKSATAQDKGPVLPEVVEVQNYYAPFIARESRRINNADLASERSFRQIQGKELDYNSLRAAVRNNGTLSGTDFQFGGPPPAISDAFAYFDPGGGNTGSKLVVVDPRDARWNPKNGNSRYNFLRDIKVMPPFEGEGIASKGKVTFYSDRDSKVIFASVFDPQTRRFYFLEGNKVENMLLHMAPPKPGAKKDMLIHMRLSELQKLFQLRTNSDGTTRAPNEGIRDDAKSGCD